MKAPGRSARHTRSRFAQGAHAALALVVAWLGPACGYSSQLTAGQGIDSVGVEIFGNDTYERDIERDLHVELTRAVRNLVDAPLAAPGEADVVLQGKLTRFSRRGGIRSPDNELLQTGLIIECQVSLLDRVSGKPLAGPLDVGVDLGFSLTGVGREAASRQRALRNLSERIALDLFTAAALRAQEAPDEPATDGVSR